MAPPWDLRETLKSCNGGTLPDQSVEQFHRAWDQVVRGDHGVASWVQPHRSAYRVRVRNVILPDGEAAPKGGLSFGVHSTTEAAHQHLRDTMWEKLSSAAPASSLRTAASTATHKTAAALPTAASPSAARLLAPEAASTSSSSTMPPADVSVAELRSMVKRLRDVIAEAEEIIRRVQPRIDEATRTDDASEAAQASDHQVAASVVSDGQSLPTENKASDHQVAASVVSDGQSLHTANKASEEGQQLHESHADAALSSATSPSASPESSPSRAVDAPPVDLPGMAESEVEYSGVPRAIHEIESHNSAGRASLRSCSTRAFEVLQNINWKNVVDVILASPTPSYFINETKLSQEAASEILRARSDCGWTNITGFANGVERANLNRPGSTYSQKSLQVCHERTFCGVARSHLQPFVEGAEVQVLRAKLIKVGETSQKWHRDIFVNEGSTSVKKGASFLWALKGSRRLGVVHSDETECEVLLQEGQVYFGNFYVKHHGISDPKTQNSIALHAYIVLGASINEDDLIN